MYDIQKLEEDWAVYNKKKKRPIYIFSILIILFISLLSTVYFNDFLNAKLKNIFNTITKQQVNNIAKYTPSKESNSSALKKESDRTLEEASKKPVKIAKSPEIIIEVKPKPYDSAMKEPVLEEVESLNKTKQPNLFSDKEDTPSKKIHLDILETSSVTAYKDVESRFYQTHDTDDSLFLAKSYFNRGEYKKAEYWALQTNKLDNTIEESWLIFAHAKAKMGERNDAIKVLQSYIGKSNSLEARRLLEKIK